MKRHDFLFAKKILTNLSKQKDSEPFYSYMNFISSDFSNNIKKPMDLLTISNKLDKKIYNSLQEFMEDILLIFNDCKNFQQPDAPIAKQAENLKIYFLTNFYNKKKNFIEDRSEEDDEDDYNSSFYKKKTIINHIPSFKKNLIVNTKNLKFYLFRI